MTIKGLREAAVERAARIIDPTSFKAWEGTFNYGVTNGETLDDARATADHFHKKAKDEARDKAREILASDPPPFRGEALTPAALEAGCRALHEMQGTLDADTPMHAPFQKSWEKPSMARWQQWTETVEVVNAAIVASPALVTPGEEDSSPSRDQGQAVGVALDISAERICEIVADGDGFWRSCSGCLELEDGQNVHGYPHSKTLGCVLGGGCRECGGLGAIWDTTDYAAMADWIAGDLSSAKPALGDSSRDAPETAVTPGVREALEEIGAERRRQVEVEGWTPAHDDQHSTASMAVAAACYAMHAAIDDKGPMFQGVIGQAREHLWPWAKVWWKPSSPRRDLIKAGALILAEIERRDRQALAALTAPVGEKP